MFFQYKEHFEHLKSSLKIQTLSLDGGWQIKIHGIKVHFMSFWSPDKHLKSAFQQGRMGRKHRGQTASTQLPQTSALDPNHPAGCSPTSFIRTSLFSQPYICWINLCWTESWSVFAERRNLRADCGAGREIRDCIYQECQSWKIPTDERSLLILATEHILWTVVASSYLLQDSGEGSSRPHLHA